MCVCVSNKGFANNCESQTECEVGDEFVLIRVSVIIYPKWKKNQTKEARISILSIVVNFGIYRGYIHTFSIFSMYFSTLNFSKFPKQYTI